VLVLDSHNTTTPGLSQLFVLVVLLVEGLSKSLKVLEVFSSDFGKSQASSSLLVDKLAKVGLATHEAVRHTTLAAERRQEDDHLDGVNVVGNHDKLGLLLLDELGDVVKTELNVNGLGTFLGRFVSGSSGEALFLLGAGLGAVFSEQFKELTGLITFNCAVELGNGWWNLKALHQNTLLALNSDVLGPSNEAGEVSLRLDVSSDSKVAWVLFEQRIFCCGASA